MIHAEVQTGKLNVVSRGFTTVNNQVEVSGLKLVSKTQVEAMATITYPTGAPDFPGEARVAEGCNFHFSLYDDGWRLTQMDNCSARPMR